MPACASDESPVDFRQRMAAMPRLLDDSDLAELRRLGISVRSVRRARRQYLLELLGDLERESDRIATAMGRLPNADLDAILVFRHATRSYVRRLRLLVCLHALGIPVETRFRKCATSATATLLAAETL